MPADLETKPIDHARYSLDSQMFTRSPQVCPTLSSPGTIIHTVEGQIICILVLLDKAMSSLLDLSGMPSASMIILEKSLDSIA